MKKSWSGFLLIIILLILWELSSRNGWVDSVSVPQVSQILKAWGGLIITGELFNQLLPSLARVFIGFLLAAAVAIPLGIIMGMFSPVYRLLEPITEFIRPIPASAYIPIAILFLGIGDEMKVFVIFLSCFFPILLNTYSGVRGVDPVLIDTGRTFGVPKVQSLYQIILPASLPTVLTGLRISIGIAIMVAVVAEMISGNNGIGYYILDMQRIFRVAEMFAGIFTLGILGYTINYLFLVLEKYLLRWRTNEV
ncbi:ABC transporter permease [Alkalihalobacillus sp. MEB130]|uniref:ABC transporter permease n=1 Tax=Alkalihalobacillus sp. MEB130 TaxID=2976704 RepID=UPI0028DD5C72|nr:ABC transporter permease [Alkalihalobacillus sp. MEB130]MDT8858920.1 ABC transporter permease [Alkalihalobacillus sp. MEB130]